MPSELLKALEDGFRPHTEYEKLGKDAGIPLTNSAFICDQARLLHLVSKGLMGPSATTVSGMRFALLRQDQMSCQ